MSTEGLTIEPDLQPPRPDSKSRSWRQNIRAVRTVRMVVAVTVAMAVAQAVNWPLSFVAPVLTVALLELPLPQPSLQDFVAYLVYAVISVVGVFLFVMLLQPFPVIFIVAYTLVIFILAYQMNKGAPFVLVLLSLLALLILPVIGNVHEALSAYVGGCLLLSEVVALVIIQLAHGILPNPESEVDEGWPDYYPGYYPEAARLATVTTATIVPAMAAFLLLNWAAQVVVLIYIGALALEGSRARGVYGTKKVLKANTMAALVAYLFYLALVAVPELQMLLLLTLLVAILFAKRRFADTPDAKYFGSALIGVIIIISTSLGATADIDKTIVLRILYIFLAGMYVIGITSIIEPLTRSEEQT